MALGVEEKVEKGYWEEENKKTTSERRGTTAHSNLKLSKFKDGFVKIVFEILIVFTKFPLLYKR